MDDDDNDDILDEQIEQKYEILDENKIKEFESKTHKVIKIAKDKITRNILSNTELAAAIGHRATLIDKGGPIFVDYSELNNPLNIAIKELKEKKFPLKLLRYAGGTEPEIWEEFNINEMIIYEKLEYEVNI